MRPRALTSVVGLNGGEKKKLGARQLKWITTSSSSEFSRRFASFDGEEERVTRQKRGAICNFCHFLRQSKTRAGKSGHATSWPRGAQHDATFRDFCLPSRCPRPAAAAPNRDRAEKNEFKFEFLFFFSSSLMRGTGFADTFQFKRGAVTIRKSVQ